MILENLYLSEEEYKLMVNIKKPGRKNAIEKEEDKIELLERLEKRGYLTSEQKDSKDGIYREFFVTRSGKIEMKNYEDTLWARKHRIIGGLHWKVQRIKEKIKGM